MRSDLVSELVDAARADLAEANRELEALRRDHRLIETALEALLEHLPVPVVLVDADLCVRAQSVAGDERWGLRVGKALDGPSLDVWRWVLAQSPPARRSVDGVELALVVEPGTAERYVLGWCAVGLA